MRHRSLSLVWAAAACLLAVAPSWAGVDQSHKSADRFPSDVASAWFERLYDVVKAERTAPPPASRIYGVTAVALYEAIVPGTEDRRSLVGQLNGLAGVPQPDKRNKKYHWPTVANAALANTIRGLYPTISPASLDSINGLEESFASQYRAVVPRPEYERSVAHGQAVAAAVVEWCDGDGFSIANGCPYVPVPVPGAWQPTPPAFSPPLQPCWGEIRPMVLASGAECALPAHPAFSTDPASAYHAASLEVYNVGRALTDEQKIIAAYWADGAGATGTPPGHWIAIASQLARSEGLSLAAAAEAYARVGIAVHDAFIACWHEKYVYNLQRPETFIRAHIDPAWTPFIGTPPFPSYASGHSTQSGAAVSVLTQMFGVRSFTDTTHSDHNLVPAQVPRTFSSFEQAGAEAAVSRLYGGIHFAFDNDNGYTSGQCIGQAIEDRVAFK